VNAPASRNAPCPCGSGRRYKECHGGLATAVAPGRVDVLLAGALEAQRAGRHDDAATGYLAALAIDGRNFDALHMLGVTRLMQRRAAEAVPLLERALVLRPGLAAVERNLALAREALAGAEADPRYEAWQRLRERPRDEARAPLRAAIAARGDATPIAILMPTFESDEALLRACLDSVQAQTYPHWRLCVADDASRAPRVRATLDAYARDDARIRVVYRDTNGHIAAASNSALELVGAPYVALLDHDDLLAPQALAEVALALAARPGAAVIYSDEDKIDRACRRHDPHFKPEFDPALLRSQNYVSHLGVYRTDLLRAVGGFRPGFEGAQDWDLALRCVERVPPCDVVHVPQVLYHWRAVEGSTAVSLAAKPYAAAASLRTVAGHWERAGVAARVTPGPDGHFVRADPLAPGRIGTTVVVLGAAGEPLARVAEAWREALGPAAEDVFAFATSAVAAPADAFDPSPPELDPGVAATIVAGIAGARGDVLLFVPAAASPPPAEDMRALLAHAMQPDNGPVGVALVDGWGMNGGGAWRLDPDAIATTLYGGQVRGMPGAFLRDRLVHRVSAVRGDAMAIRRELWERLGGFDADCLARRYHDVDLGLRAAAAGAPPLYHGGIEWRLARPVRTLAPRTDRGGDAEAVRRRWGGRLACDPAYHGELDRGAHPFAPRVDPLSAVEPAP